MANVVGLLLTAVNFYCHLIGLSNFEYDWRTGQFWTLSITNLAILQYCLTVLSVRAKYKRLSTELRQIMKECEELSLVTQRNGVFMTRCCYLSDRLEEMALRQDQLQSIVVELNKTIGSQGVLVYSGYYISMVFCSYLTYSLIKNGREYFCLSLKHVILSYAWNFFYYFDALINFSLILSFLDDHKEVIRLLENRTLFASRLDSRLEESLEKFQLQLIRNPLKLTIMNLFPISRNCTAAMCGSIVTHTIVLIQYDLENF
ncbi:putative gustatory receptor 36a [Drosophila ficusphila]|uniref:putative gustatory receptor 36a n=1 Tax=Drosophila ficusphila TaxID=30025 RepID=UPI001C88EED9|nr:putative gustatory receptor 36a [Drosophila ficusphila]